jgi:hypothetical protein
MKVLFLEYLVIDRITSRRRPAVVAASIYCGHSLVSLLFIKVMDSMVVILGHNCVSNLAGFLAVLDTL